MINIKTLIQQQMDLASDIVLNYPWQDPRAYGMWLAQTYYMVSHSTRLVALAGAYCPLDKSGLHARFVDHAKEERGHEKVCVSDIKALGYELSDFPQTYQSSSMYQIQYYWIQHHNPVSFFGYTLALECLAEQFGPQVHKIIHEAHGPSACKFLKLHSEDDVEHTQSAYQQLESLNETEMFYVRDNLILSSEIYRGMMIESKARMQSLPIKTPKKVA